MASRIASGKGPIIPAIAALVSNEVALMRRIPEKLRPMVLPILMALWNPQNQ
jgi:hypothetical protein